MCSLGSEFWAAMAGATLGGGIAFVLQTISLREARRQREEDRLEVRQALGQSVLFKAIAIHSNLSQIYDHIECGIDNLPEAERAKDYWRRITPLANLPDRVQFNPAELSLVVWLKDSDLLNTVLGLDSVHNSVLDHVELYSTLRQQLSSQLTTHLDGIDGNVGCADLNEENMRLLKPRVIEIDSLIDGIRNHRKGNQQDAFSVMSGIQVALKSKLGLLLELELDPKT